MAQSVYLEQLYFYIIFRIFKNCAYSITYNNKLHNLLQLSILPYFTYWPFKLHIYYGTFYIIFAWYMETTNNKHIKFKNNYIWTINSTTWNCRTWSCRIILQKNPALQWLTRWGWVTHICISVLDYHWFRPWLVALSTQGTTDSSLLTGRLETTFSDILIKIQQFAIEKNSV